MAIIDPEETRDPTSLKVCIVGASGKLGQYMVQHALDRDYDVVGVCREHSVGKLDPFKGRITVIPGATNDRDVINSGVAMRRTKEFLIARSQGDLDEELRAAVREFREAVASPEAQRGLEAFRQKLPLKWDD